MRKIYAYRQGRWSRGFLWRVLAVLLVLGVGFFGGLIWRATEVQTELAKVNQEIQAVAKGVKNPNPPDLARKVDFNPTTQELTAAFDRIIRDWNQEKDLFKQVKADLLARFAGKGELDKASHPYWGAEPFIERAFFEPLDLGMTNRIGALEVLLAETRVRLLYLEYERALWKSPWGAETQKARANLLQAVRDMAKLAERAFYAD